MEPTINGVANHCFRWCERCPFTGRCHTFLMGREFDDTPLEYIPASFTYMSQPFSSYWPQLRALTEDRGSDWSMVSRGLDQQTPAAGQLMRLAEIRRVSREISVDVAMFSSEQLEWLRHEGRYDTALGQGTTCLRWYGSMLGAKFARLVGIEGEEVSEDVDTDPTVKLLHLILVRLIAAISLIVSEAPAAGPTLFPLFRQYCRLLQYLRIIYPRAYLLHRAGFDNPRYADEIMAFYGGVPPIDPFRDNSWSAGGRAPRE